MANKSYDRMYKAMLLDLIPPPSSENPTTMSTSQRESSPFYLLEIDLDNDAIVTPESVNVLLNMVNYATAEFSSADRARIKRYYMENGNLPPQDRFKLLLATAIPLYGQVFSNYKMDAYIPNYQSHAISACLTALSAFCKVVGIDGPYATPSPSPSPAPPSPLLPLGLAAQMVNLQGLCEEDAMDSELATPTAPVVLTLHPMSPVPPGPLPTPSPHPPTHPPAPTTAPKPKPT